VGRGNHIKNYPFFRSIGGGIESGETAHKPLFGELKIREL
jgi:hypothetical protein